MEYCIFCVVAEIWGCNKGQADCDCTGGRGIGIALLECVIKVLERHW